LGCLEADIPFQKAFDVTQNSIMMRMLNPFWKFQRFFKIGSEGRFQKSIIVVNSLVKDIIKRRRTEDVADKPDLLSRFIQLGQIQGVPMPDEYLRDVALNFIIAGRDTTAQLLTWTTIMLFQHPEVLAKLREEVDGAFGPKDIPDYQTVANMPYAHAVLSETLRLYPPVPGIFKISIKSDVLPDGTIVPEKYALIYSAYALGRMKWIWGDDAKVYRPERWLEDGKGGASSDSSSSSSPSSASSPLLSPTTSSSDGGEDISTSSSSSSSSSSPSPSSFNPFYKPLYKLKPTPPDWVFPAFNAGARTCLGKPAAYLEAKMLLGLLVRRYDITVVPGQELVPRISITLPLKNGLLVRVQQRK